MGLEKSEILFTFVVFAFTLVDIFIFKKHSLEMLGFKPTSLFKGWESISVFAFVTFGLIQLLGPRLDLPEWFIDQDQPIPLLMVVAAQEILFRGYLLTWLKFLGKQKALIVVTVLFGSIHLVHSSPIFVTIISLVGGYFWGWHFYKNKNMYLLILSHLLVNLSFNYFFLLPLL